jgi:hypothetical protein
MASLHFVTFLAEEHLYAFSCLFAAVHMLRCIIIRTIEMSGICRKISFFPALVILCATSFFASWLILQHLLLVPLNASIIPTDRISNWMLWNKTSTLHAELNLTCRWLDFPARANSTQTERFCALQSHESLLVDGSIDSGHDRDCDRLTDLWNQATSGNRSGVYVEVGAGIEKCLLHMLMNTNASVVALEAQPDRLFSLSSTLMRMNNVYRNRVSLYLHKGGNSTVLAHADQDRLAVANLLNKQNFLQHGATLDAYMEPLSFITKDRALSHIALLKLNMPGYTCHVLDGVTLERTRILSLGDDASTTLQNRHCSLTSLQTKLADASFKKENVHGSIFYRREPKIPHRLVFTFRKNILKTKAPKVFYNNVQNTIRRYREAWGEPNAPVWFLTDDACRSIIKEANSTLLPFFEFEYGKYKADICRVAALYLKGGYYFDVDLEVIQPVMLSSKTSFSTVLADDNNLVQFFQAFMASEPKSPVLAESFADMIFWYEHPERREPRYGNMGPKTLMDAFNRVPTAKRGQVRLLQETNPNATSFPSVPRRKGVGCCCNFIVYDPMDGEAYFYSRILGAGPFCAFPYEKENTREAQSKLV